MSIKWRGLCPNCGNKPRPSQLNGNKIVKMSLRDREKADAMLARYWGHLKAHPEGNRFYISLSDVKAFVGFPGKFLPWMMLRMKLLRMRLRELYQNKDGPQPGDFDRMLLVQLSTAIEKRFIDYVACGRTPASGSLRETLYNLEHLHGDIITHHIHKRQFVAVEIQSLDIDSKECSICYKVYSKDLGDRDSEPPVKTYCNHIFGHSCIQRWCLLSEECPNCRRNLLPPLAEIPKMDQDRASYAQSEMTAEEPWWMRMLDGERFEETDEFH
jgi:hypothetical protein